MDQHIIRKQAIHTAALQYIPFSWSLIRKYTTEAFVLDTTLCVASNSMGITQAVQ